MRINSAAVALIGVAAALFFGLSGCGNEPDSPSHGEEAAITPAANGPPPSAADVEAALAAADAYVNSEEFAKARAILAVLIEKAPSELRARELMGQVLIAQAGQAETRGDQETAAAARREAWTHYQAAIAVDPESAGLRHSAAMIALAAGEPDAALTQFCEASRLDPLNPQHPLFEAQILIQREDFPTATAALDRVLALDPDEPFAHASLAVIASEQRRFDAALEHIAQARQIRPAELAFRVQEAKIHRRSGDPRRGLALLTPLPASDRVNEGVTFELAACSTELGDHAQAAEAWAHRHERQPAGPRAYLAAVRAGEALLRAGRVEEARHWLDEAQRLAASAPEVEALKTAIGAATRPN